MSGFKWDLPPNSDVWILTLGDEKLGELTPPTAHDDPYWEEHLDIEWKDREPIPCNYTTLEEAKAGIEKAFREEIAEQHKLWSDRLVEMFTPNEEAGK